MPIHSLCQRIKVRGMAINTKKQEARTNGRRPNRTCNVYESFPLQPLQTTGEERKLLILNNIKALPFRRARLVCGVFIKFAFVPSKDQHIKPILDTLSFTPKFSGAPSERGQADLTFCLEQRQTGSLRAPFSGLRPSTTLQGSKLRPGEGRVATVPL